MRSTTRAEQEARKTRKAVLAERRAALSGLPEIAADHNRRLDAMVLRSVKKVFQNPLFGGRRRMPAQSSSMKRRWKVYEAAVRRWWKRVTELGGGRCEFRTEDGGPCRRKAQKRPHHKAGRRGANLHDDSKFMAVCWQHHNWIHDNPKEATDRGYLIRER